MSAFKYFVLGWILGLILGFGVIQDLDIPLAVRFIMPAIASILLLIKYLGSKTFQISVALIILAGASSGILHQSITNRANHLDDLHSRTSGKVIVEKLWGTTQQLVLRTSEGKVLLRKPVSLSPILKKGDQILFSPNYKRLQKSQEIGEFDDSQYWKGYGVRYYCWQGKNDNLLCIDSIQGKGLKILERLRYGFIGHIAHMRVSKSNRAILLAMITGDKRGLEKEQKEMFSQLGIMHLMAVSGLHLGLVFIIISQSLSLIGLKAHSPFNRFVSILVVWIYGLICGLPPSAIRAASMLTVYHVGRIFNRHVPGLYVVFLVAFIHSFIAPASVFAAGFQLSYLAVLGILIYLPRMIKLFKASNKIVVRIRDLLSISLSAQVFTWPVSVHLFAAFPAWFLLSNLLLLPIGIIIFYSGLGLTFLSSLGIRIGFLEMIFDEFMKVWILLGESINKLPGGFIEFDTFPTRFLIFYVILLWISRSGLRSCINKPQSILILFMFWSFFSFFNTFVPN